MKTKTRLEKCSRALIYVLVLAMAAPAGTFGQDGNGGPPPVPQEELEQILAPVALYPDSLLAQVLMGSTYPLEIVQADRWAKQNQTLKGDALTAALEKQPWDPSVKSLVNFPPVLSMMSEKLDWTQKLGDAFLADQKRVMDSVQRLRNKAVETGNLETTKEQVVVVEKETVVIKSASPEVVYVPTYNPTVVYGAWPYPAYPPYYYYPPGYTAGAALFSFGVGVAVGAAWGYAWGGCNWRGGDVDIDVNRNLNVNRNINRNNYVSHYQGGQGKWQHNPQHRKGVSYRDQATAQRYNRASTNQAVKSREAFRGRAEAGRQDIARGDADRFKGDRSAGRQGGLEGNRAGTRESGIAGTRESGRAGTRESGNISSRNSGSRDFGSSQRRNQSAFSGMDRSGASTRQFSDRGSSSRQSMSSRSSGGGSRSFGGGRGGGRR